MKSTVVCFFYSSLQYIYVIYMLPICINLRQTIFKIHVKLLVQEIYSPSRGEDYICERWQVGTLHPLQEGEGMAGPQLIYL